MGPGQYLFIPIPQETLPETWSIIAVDMEGNAIGTFLPPGPVYAVFPSPNAEEIATLSQVGGLQVGSTDNGLANPMIRLGQTASWAPNSPALAVVINGDIFVLDTVHGDLHLLADCDTIVHYAECDDPAWSPDGTMIIFSSVGGPTLDEPTDGLYVIEPACLETLSLCEASRKGPFPLLESVTWSPDSAMIAGFADNGDIGILEAPQFRNLRTFPIPHRPPGGDYAHYLAWSPDGNWLAYIWSCNVWLLSPETAESHGLYTDCALLSQGGPISWLTVAR